MWLLAGKQQQSSSCLASVTGATTRVGGRQPPCFQPWSPYSVHISPVQVWHFSDNNPHGGNRLPPFAALFVLPALGICLQRACINTPCCLRLSRLIDSFNTSVIIIQRSWLSANSSTELAVQLPVYYFKMSGERSGENHMPIWLWAACEVPCEIWRVKPGVWAVLSGWWLTTSDIGLNNSPQKRKHVCLQINF